MNSSKKHTGAYKTIGEVTKELNLVDKRTGRLQTHTLRYWQKQFKQLNPSVKAGNRRYYSKNDLLIIKEIKFLLKDKGLTISGAKKLLSDKKTLSLDESTLMRENSTKTEILREKIKKISKIVGELKKIKNG